MKTIIFLFFYYKIKKHNLDEEMILLNYLYFYLKKNDI